MHYKRIILLMIGCMCHFVMIAETESKDSVADIKSLELFYTSDWKGLLAHGKATIHSGTDFPLLRMRTGYAALSLGKYSESLKQYSKAYSRDKQNAVALYYLYLNNYYLNNITAVRFYAGKMSKESRNTEKLKRFKLSALNFTYSYKYPDVDARGKAQYLSAGVNIQLGYRLELQQTGALFNQTISEPSLEYVTDNTNIAIDQKEYYGKLIFAFSGSLSLIGGYHYIYTPFNNYTYNNNLGFGGIKYSLPYIHLQAMMHSGTVSDSAYRQFEATISTYPLGNTNLYTITRASYWDQFTLTQIAGVNVMKNVWLEVNTTLGKYDLLLDNDGLYLFNDIDTKIFKAGGTVYLLMAKKLLFSLNYIFEEKQRYGTTDSYFYQHSITTGLVWNM